MRCEEKSVRNLDRVSAPLSGQSLVEEGSSSRHVDIRRRELWSEAGEAVTKSLAGLRAGVESNLVQVAHALRALGVPYETTPSELVSITKTTLTIGDSLKPFGIRFEGQHERFSELLAAIDVPLAIRIRNPRGIGFAEFTPEAAQNIHINNTKLRYPGFLAAVQSAYNESLRSSGDRFTTAERLRTDRNLAAAERLGEFVDEFNLRRSDLSVVSLRIVRNGEEPGILSAGPLNDKPADHIVLVRRAVLGEFGAFLKDQFFQA